jgi:hexokinase
MSRFELSSSVNTILVFFQSPNNKRCGIPTDKKALNLKGVMVYSEQIPTVGLIEPGVGPAPPKKIMTFYETIMHERAFELTTDQLTAIARQFSRDLTLSLTSDRGPMACLPTFVRLGVRPRGRALVLDFGGTHLRAALATVEPCGIKIERGPHETDLPVRRDRPLESSEFLDLQARLIEDLDPEPGLPLGYCFSYPAEQTPDGDARLIRWTKGVDITGMVGQTVGRMLIETLARRGLVCGRVTVINDTVASLLAGLSTDPAAITIGLIVGTGTNMAGLVNASSLARLTAEQQTLGALPVNLESGNFTPPGLTAWDDQVDRTSTNPGRQRFEKAVSGVYLPRLMAAICPDAAIVPEESAARLSGWADGSLPCPTSQQRLAIALLRRSARLTAAALGGFLLFQNGPGPLPKVRIVTEGALILKAPGYKDQVDGTLRRLLPDLGLSPGRIELARIPQANLIGSALAALSSPATANEPGKDALT